MSQPAKRTPKHRPAPTTVQALAINGPRTATWRDAVDTFLAEGRRRNLSAATLQNYEWYLDGLRLRTFMADHALSTPAQLFNGGMLERFELELAVVGLESSTVATFHRVFKNLAGFLIKRGGWGIDGDVLTLQAPIEVQRRPEPFTEPEIEALKRAARSERDRVIVEIYVRTGIRLSELVNLDVGDIKESPDGWYLMIRQGKGRKDRLVPLDTPKNRLSAKLIHYVRRVRPANTRQTALFLSLRKEQELVDPTTRARMLDYARLKPRAVQIMFRRLWDETGIHAHAHRGRHTFATNSLRAGVDPLMLKKALGHNTLRMVDRYVQYNEQDVLAAWTKRSD